MMSHRLQYDLLQLVNHKKQFVSKVSLQLKYPGSNIFSVIGIVRVLIFFL